MQEGIVAGQERRKIKVIQDRQNRSRLIIESRKVGFGREQEVVQKQQEVVQKQQDKNIRTRSTKAVE